MKARLCGLVFCLPAPCLPGRQARGIRFALRANLHPRSLGKIGKQVCLFRSLTAVIDPRSDADVLILMAAITTKPPPCGWRTCRGRPMGTIIETAREIKRRDLLGKIELFLAYFSDSAPKTQAV